jgi:POT family proton-dependent oligopeptide transporter
MNQTSVEAADFYPSRDDRRFFGHPLALATLFFAEMWERFSYYGMRALLILFMTASVENGGLGFDTAKAATLYGLYTALAYLSGLPGGWVADKLIGQRKAVFLGGIVIMAGHISLALHGLTAFYAGLILVIIGTGLLKPNMSSLVGSLYSPEDTRRDAGFSVYYMGVNLGAMLAPLACGYLAQSEGFKAWLSQSGFNPVNSWHWGFGAAAVGMGFGLIQFAMGWKNLGRAGEAPSPAAEDAAALRRRLGIWSGGGLLAFVLFAVLSTMGVLTDPIGLLSKILGVALIALPALFFWQVFQSSDYTLDEKKRMSVVGILFFFTALFWASFEQAGSSFNLFADRFTANEILGFSFPSSWFQSVNSVFIIILAPLFSVLWVKLGPKEPSSPGKFVYGLFFVSLGFLIMSGAAMASGPEGLRVSPMWLLSVYLVHTIGELCISPVGLSLVTKLAPLRAVSQLMAIWFTGSALGNFIGGHIAALFETFALPTLFGAIFGTTLLATLALAALIPTIRRLMGTVH